MRRAILGHRGGTRQARICQPVQCRFVRAPLLRVGIQCLPVGLDGLSDPVNGLLVVTGRAPRVALHDAHLLEALDGDVKGIGQILSRHGHDVQASRASLCALARGLGARRHPRERIACGESCGRGACERPVQQLLGLKCIPGVIGDGSQCIGIPRQIRQRVLGGLAALLETRDNLTEARRGGLHLPTGNHVAHGVRQPGEPILKFSQFIVRQFEPAVHEVQVAVQFCTEAWVGQLCSRLGKPSDADTRAARELCPLGEHGVEL